MLISIFDKTTSMVRLDELAKGPLDALGITVHYTADRNLERTVQSLLGRGLCYHVIIDRDGAVTQMASLDKQVWHAGNALWMGKSPNRHHVAVSLVGWGDVKPLENGNYVAWNGEEIPAVEVRKVLAGTEIFWDAATEDQEAMLEDFCLWACRQGIAPSNICGHDECALPAGRKHDPGGMLSFTMADFRRRLAGKLKNV